MQASKTSLTDLYGVGPVLACEIIGFTGDVRRFPDRDKFAVALTTERHRSNCRLVVAWFTDSHAAVTAASTTPFTWQPSVRSDTPSQQAGPTSTRKWPPAARSARQFGRLSAE